MNHTDSTPDLSGATEIFVLLHNWYPVRIELLESVRIQLKDVCLMLVPGTRYKAKHLCGEGYWKALGMGERRLVGSCISHLIRIGELLLIKVTADGTYPNGYELPV